MSVLDDISFLDNTNHDTDLYPPVGSLLGKPPNHWVCYPGENVIDLTRPSGPDYLQPCPGAVLRMETTTENILCTPKKSALVIIDMQNLFLSPALGKDPDGAGNRAKEVLKTRTIPAARAAGMQIIWLNWGLDETELQNAPPSLMRLFGGLASLKEKGGSRSGIILVDGATPRPAFKGPGSNLGHIELEDGIRVDCGRLLLRDTWNTALPPDLQRLYEEGMSASPPDVWIHKDRQSGMWGDNSACNQFLEREGITTLFFAGVNTDQCVGGTLADAFYRGYDTVLVKDACGTSSPDFARQAWEFNSVKTYGFCTESNQILKGAEKMMAAQAS